MRRWVENVFHLGLKELASLSRDVVMVVLIIYVFTVAVYSEATAMKTDVSNAAVAVVDADQSTLSSRIKDAVQPPYFRTPHEIDRSELDQLLDKGQYTFILEIPPRLEADLLANRGPSIQINVDATAVTQAAVGTAYIQEIIMRETASFLKQRGANLAVPIDPVIRALFNQNLEAIRFSASMGVINNVTILAIVLVGAAVMRERERGTIEHLLVMPVLPSEILAAKIWANGLVILLAAGFSLHVIVHVVLQVPIVGSVEFFLAGAAVYLFAVTSLSILLATIANSMPQFTLLSIPVFVIMFLLAAHDVLTPKPHTVSESAGLAEITDLLESHHIKRVPVVRDGAVAGIVSRANLVQALASGQKSHSIAADPDKSIRDQVAATLAGQPWQTQLPRNAIIANGVVHLWGLVNSEEERIATRVAVERVPGVKGIVDHLVVRPIVLMDA